MSMCPESYRIDHLCIEYIENASVQNEDAIMPLKGCNFASYWSGTGLGDNEMKNGKTENR